ncbi:PEP-CTERM sorting domain-containing protein [Sedimenticola sp.]|uniref:PEP-CTERM sorting domain-containing protein n=1 Tax=Sedimenticola sp. TaxID=1940285 RepID=UPI003D09F37A
MKNFLSITMALVCYLCSNSAMAVLYDVTMTGLVEKNQTNLGICPAQGFNVCHYFPLNDTISMTFRYDDTTPVAYNLTASNTVYDNVIKSLSFSSDAVGYTGSYIGDFGQVIVRNGTKDGLTFRFWESTQNIFANATADPMDLTTLPTSLAYPADDIYGDLEIDAIRINLTSLSDTLFNSSDLPTAFSLTDFDDPVSTNWSFNVRTSSGWRGSVGVGINGVSVQQVAASPGTATSATVAEPSSIIIIGLGLVGLSTTRRRLPTDKLG